MMSLVRGLTLLVSPFLRIVGETHTTPKQKLRDMTADFTGVDYHEKKFVSGFNDDRGLLIGWGPYIGTYVVEAVVNFFKDIAQSFK